MISEAGMLQMVAPVSRLRATMTASGPPGLTMTFLPSTRGVWGNPYWGFMRKPLKSV